MIGLSLLYFLAGQIGLSVELAIFGTRKWKTVLKRLHSIHNYSVKEALTEAALLSMVDAIDDDGKEMIDSDELLDVLLKLNFKITPTKSKCCFEQQTKVRTVD
jgi:hypothetical protein